MGKNKERARPYKMQGNIPVDIGDRRLYDNYDPTITDKFQQKLKRIDVSEELSQFPQTTLSLLEKRYLITDEDGNVTEDTQGLFTRVASNVAYADMAYGATENQAYKSAKDFYQMMITGDFMPNSPALMNAGRDLQQLSACFVLPIEDSMQSILGTQKDAGLVHKSGGGTGFSWSRLRMANDLVTSTYGLSSGPVRFMGAYDRTTEAVNQGGTRRGANMGVIDYNHPDILEFIKLKTEEGECANFNLSVGLGDEFMTAAQFGDWYTLMNRKKGEESPVRREDLEKMMRAVDQGKINVPEMNFYLNEKGEPVENVAGLSARFNEKGELQLNAREVFEYIVDSAWKLGEPGVLFMDTINKANPTPQLGRIEATNPCGEQPLLPYESCNLGSLNISNFIRDGQLDEERLAKTVRKGVRFLDNVVDMSRFPLEEINHMVHQTRKIGLGVMGWGDALIKMNIPYDSETAIEMADKVMGLIDTTAKEESEQLAKERGVFPTYFGSIYEGKRLMRNASVTTVAPTGSVSKIARETSGGIEPRFSIITTHTDSDGEERTTVIPTFAIDMKKYGVKGEQLEGIMEQLKGRKDEDGKWIEKPKKLTEIEGVPQEIIEIYKTANDIPVEAHIKMQAAFQRHVDSAVSKTINLPNEATREDVRNAYLYAYKLGCKGLTVYRDRSRDKQVLTSGGGGTQGKLEEIVSVDVEMRSTAIYRGEDVEYYKIEKGDDTFHVSIVGEFFEDKETGKIYALPVKMFQNTKPLGNEGSTEFGQSGLDRTGRLKSIDPDWAGMIREWKSVTGHMPRGMGPGRINSPSHGVGLAFEHYCLSRGIVEYETIGDKETGNLINAIHKPKLERIKDKKRIERLRKSKGKTNGSVEHRLFDNIHEKFECPECHSLEFHKESGCDDPVCNGCGWSKGKCG